MALPLIGAIPVIGSIIENIIGVIGKAIPDKDTAAKLQHDVTMKIMEIQYALQNGQIEVNKVEAASPSLFVAGWRPAVGWTCALALFWQFVGYDTSLFVLSLLGKEVSVPQLVASQNLFELVLAMLGLAGYRTYERSQGKV